MLDKIIIKGARENNLKKFFDKLMNISINSNNEEYYLNRGYLKHISNMQEKASREELMTAARNGVIILNCAGWKFIYGATVVDAESYGTAQFWEPNGAYGDMVQHCAYTAEYEPPAAN